MTSGANEARASGGGSRTGAPSRQPQGACPLVRMHRLQVEISDKRLLTISEVGIERTFMPPEHLRPWP